MMDDAEIWKFIYENSGLSLSEFEAFGGVSGLLPPTPTPLHPGQRQLSTSSESSASATASDPSASVAASASSTMPDLNAHGPTFSALLDDLPSLPDAIESEFLLRGADRSTSLAVPLPLQIQTHSPLESAMLPSPEQTASGAAFQLSPEGAANSAPDAAAWLQLQQAQLAYWNENAATATSAAGIVPTVDMTQAAWEAQSAVWAVPAPELVQLQPLAAPADALAGTQLTALGASRLCSFPCMRLLVCVDSCVCPRRACYLSAPRAVDSLKEESSGVVVACVRVVGALT